MNGIRQIDAQWITARPIAHRGLHGLAAGIPENTIAAARAAARSGYAIEVDLLCSSDGVPVVFHDFGLKRLAGRDGRIVDCTAAEIGSMRVGGSSETIPTLQQLLQAVAGKTGLVIELKDTAGLHPNFVAAVCQLLDDYDGQIAVMSFSHRLLRQVDAKRRRYPLGLTAEGGDDVRAVHATIDREIGFDFLSYSIRDLSCRFVAEFAARGQPLIAWTVRTAGEAEYCRAHNAQITFEDFLP